MPYFKRTNLFKRIIFSRGMVIVVILAILLIGYEVFSIVGKGLDAAKARKVAESQAADLKTKEAELTAKLAALNTPEGKEAILREQFPVVKEGEHVVVITEDDRPTIPPNSADQSASSGGFWNFLKNLFR